jgi:ferredoxin
MHVIDEQRCFKCGLCVSWCPQQAIIGVGRDSISHSLVYDKVYIDADVCTDCGSCMTEGRPCPSEAIYDGAIGLPERAPADGAKYNKYIYHYDFENDSYYKRFRPAPVEEATDTAGESPDTQNLFAELPWKWITRLDDDAVPGSNFYVAHWVFPHDDPMPGVGHPPHVHKDAELIMVMGGDPEHPEELGAEIEVFLGPDMERHIIDKSCVIFIPPYFMHCPWRILRTTKPWIFMEVNQGPRHTEKTYKQLVPREALDNDSAQDFFKDEGFDPLVQGD